MAEDATVTVLCNAHNGLVIQIVAPTLTRVHLKQGENPDISEAFMDEWFLENKNSSLIESGTISII